MDLGAISTLATAALAIAALAALESLLCATVADAMTVNERHDPDRELFGQGLANIVVPMFGGIPATAAIARTAVNVRAGAGSRLAAVSHAVILLALVFVAAPLVSAIPLAALAGVLFATCVRMVEASSLIALVRSTRSDALIVCLTFAVTVALDLVTAVGVGVAVAVVLALRTVASSARIDEVTLGEGDHSEEEHALLAEHVVAYRIDGPLFFAAAHRLLLELPDLVEVEVVILRMSRVTTLDATGAHVLGDTITRLERRGIAVLLSGLAPEHEAVLTSLGIAGAAPRSRPHPARHPQRHRGCSPPAGRRRSVHERNPEPCAQLIDRRGIHLLQVTLHLRLRLLRDVRGVAAELSRCLTSSEEVPRLVELSLQLDQSLAVLGGGAGLAELVLFVDQGVDAPMDVVVLGHGTFSARGVGPRYLSRWLSPPGSGEIVTDGRVPADFGHDGPGARAERRVVVVEVPGRRSRERACPGQWCRRADRRGRGA